MKFITYIAHDIRRQIDMRSFLQCCSAPTLLNKRLPIILLCKNVNQRTFASSYDENVLSSEFDEHQIAAIIQTFNNHNEKELNSIPLFSNQLAQNIVKYREENGPFEQLSDVIQVKRMGPVLFGKVCHSIIRGDKKKTRQAAVGAGEIVPSLTPHQYKNVESVVSYRFQQNQFVWIHMNRYLEVLDWNMDNLFETETLKYEHHVYQTKIRSVIDQFPISSLYISEEKTPLMNHTKQLASLLRDARTEAITTTLLNQQLEETGVHKVFKLRSNVVGKYFKLLVAGERVSGRDIVKSLLNNSSELSREMLIPAGFAQWYFGNTVNSRQQDQIASTLLTAIVLFKDIIKPKVKDDDSVPVEQIIQHLMSDSSDEEL